VRRASGGVDGEGIKGGRRGLRKKTAPNPYNRALTLN